MCMYLLSKCLTFHFSLSLRLCVFFLFAWRCFFVHFCIHKKISLIRFCFPSFWSKGNLNRLICFRLWTYRGELKNDTLTTRRRKRQSASGRLRQTHVNHMRILFKLLTCICCFCFCLFSLFCHLFLILDHTPFPIRNEKNFIKSFDIDSKLFHYFIHSSLCYFAEIRFVIIFYSIRFHFWAVKLSKWNECVLCMGLNLFFMINWMIE